MECGWNCFLFFPSHIHEEIDTLYSYLNLFSLSLSLSFFITSIQENTINKISSEIVKSPGKQDFVNITFDMIVDGSASDKGKQNGVETTSGNNINNNCNIEK